MDYEEYQLQIKRYRLIGIAKTNVLLLCNSKHKDMLYRLCDTLDANGFIAPLAILALSRLPLSDFDKAVKALMDEGEILEYGEFVRLDERYEKELSPSDFMPQPIGE